MTFQSCCSSLRESGRRAYEPGDFEQDLTSNLKIGEVSRRPSLHQNNTEVALQALVFDHCTCAQMHSMLFHAENTNTHSRTWTPVRELLWCIEIFVADSGLRVYSCTRERSFEVPSNLHVSRKANQESNERISIVYSTWDGYKHSASVSVGSRMGSLRYVSSSVYQKPSPLSSACVETQRRLRRSYQREKSELGVSIGDRRSSHIFECCCFLVSYKFVAEVKATYCTIVADTYTRL